MFFRAHAGKNMHALIWAPSTDEIVYAAGSAIVATTGAAANGGIDGSTGLRSGMPSHMLMLRTAPASKPLGSTTIVEDVCRACILSNGSYDLFCWLQMKWGSGGGTSSPGASASGCCWATGRPSRRWHSAETATCWRLRTRGGRLSCSSGTCPLARAWAPSQVG